MSDYVYEPIDKLAEETAVMFMNECHGEAVALIALETKQIVQASQLAADCLQAGGKIHYSGAGSSGLIAMTDALELWGTFGIDADQICIHLAEGYPKGPQIAPAKEDDVQKASLVRNAISPNDLVLLVSASGDTPYTCEVAKLAHQIGAKTISVTNNSQSFLANYCKISIATDTAKEPLEGSTRLSAGTAQKIILNHFSTLLGIALGHVFEGRMINLQPKNSKLRKRAQKIVSDIGEVSIEAATQALNAHEYKIKHAILSLYGAQTDQIEEFLQKHNGKFSAALHALKNK